MNRWPEYNAGKLIAPAIVQHDQIGNEHLVWIWDGVTIIGPLSRKIYDEKQLFDDVVFLKSLPIETVVEDSKDMEIATLKKEISDLKAEIVILKVTKTGK